ncbi:MAG: Ig-like domain-containing protein, partial [Pricia sp.]
AITDYSIRPSSYGITGTINGTKLQFNLDGSRYLEIKINQRTLLYILVDPMETDIPASTGTNIYNIGASPYTADNSGETEVTSTIQQAIDDASSNGGGIVYVPEGVYQTGSLALKDDVEIYLQGGAVLRATLNKSSYFNTNPKHIIKAVDASNVKVYGRGSIDCRGVQLNDYEPTDETGTFRIGPIQLENTQNAFIDGVLLVESSAWTLTFTEGSNNILAKNIKIINEMQWGWNDGINVIGGHDINVEHCFISTADDAACVKTQNFPKADPGDAAYNITYDDVVMRSGISSGFKVGMQAEDDIYNVTVKNIDVLDCERAFNIDHWYGNGNWYDIHFVDWTVDKMTGSPQNIRKGTYIDSPFRMEIIQQPSSSYEVGLGSISDIEITRIKFNDLAPNDAYFWGENIDNRITNVTIEDLYFGDNLILSSADGNIQNKGFASDITYNGGPEISFESPLLGAEIEIEERLIVKVAPSNADEVSKIDLYLNDTFVSSVNAAPFSWNAEGQENPLENIEIGNYSLKAIAFNADGATSEITTQLTVFDPSAIPVITFESLLPGTYLKEGEGLTVIVAPIEPDTQISNIDLYLGDTFIRSEGGAPYAWNDNNQSSDAALRNLAGGTYELRAVATYNGGETTELTTTIYVDDPDAVSTIKFNLQPGTELKKGEGLTVFVEKATPDISISKVDLYLDGTFIRSEGGAPYAWNDNNQSSDAALNNMTVGRHFLRAVATDNQGELYDIGTLITVDDQIATAPIAFESPLPETELEEGGGVTVIVGRTNSNIGIAKIDLYLNDAFIRTEGGAPYAWNDNNQSSDAALRDLAIGTYLLRAIATDNQGDTYEISISISVTAPNVPPTLSFESLLPGTELEEDGGLTVVVDAEDSDGNIANIDLYLGYTFIRSEGAAPYAWNDNNQSSDAALRNLGVGNYTLKAIATDDDGATAEITTSITVSKPQLQLPGRIEGEDFEEQGGTMEVLPALDSDGTEAISFLSDGAFVGYPVVVTENGVFNFTYRVQGFDEKAELSLQLNGKKLHKIKVKKVKKSGSDWQEISATEELDAGEYSLKLISKKGRVRLNWWQTEIINSGQQSGLSERNTVVEKQDQVLIIYPNPSNGNAKIDIPGAENIQVKVYDLQGQLVLDSKVSDSNGNLDLASFPNGLYLLRIKADGKDYERRIILNEQ